MCSPCPPLQDKFGASLRVLATFKGAALDGCQYRHPTAHRLSPVVVGGDYITTAAGTGLVHTAPGHGQEDYMVRGGGVGCVCMHRLRCVDFILCGGHV